MVTFTLRLETRQVALLKERAKGLNCSQAAIVRNLIDAHLANKKRLSLYDLTKDLCGSVRGPKDLSTWSLVGYGRD